jgi:hypothetical protein
MIIVPKGKDITSAEEYKRIEKQVASDLTYLNKRFDKTFKDQSANKLINVPYDLYDYILDTVNFDYESKIIDVSRLTDKVSKEDMKLYVKIIEFISDYIKGQPMSLVTLRRFQGLLNFYLQYLNF